MEEKFKNLPLRSGVGIVVLNKENKVFVAKRIDNHKNFWQMPQGGVNNGEDFLTADDVTFFFRNETLVIFMPFRGKFGFQKN